MNPVWLAAAWLAYALLHSLLASLAVKGFVARRWPAAMPYYRLAFNGIAAVAALPLAGWNYAYPGEWLWRWQGAAAWLANGLALAAVAGFVVSTRAYDMDEFLGLRQLREREHGARDKEGFVISPFHRYVRHPWYLFGLVIVWTRDMTEAWLVSALAITAYFTVGSWFEERKLIVFHGDAYRRYREKVPGLLPRPWRYLRKADADALFR